MIEELRVAGFRPRALESLIAQARALDMKEIHEENASRERAAAANR